MRRIGRFAGLLVATLFVAREGWVSGSAGASIASRYYKVRLETEVRVILAVPPGEDPALCYAEFFKNVDAPYVRWLARARPDLDAVFEKAVGNRKLPIGGYVDEENPPRAENAVLEDEDDFKRPLSAAGEKSPMRPGLISMDVILKGGVDPSHADFTIRVLSRTKRSDLNRLKEELAEALEARAEDKPTDNP
jgi:hypothetical protein